MKSFDEYLVEMGMPVPGGSPAPSRELEGFMPILDSLKFQAKSVGDPEVKSKIYALVNPFYEEMANLLSSYKAKGQGYSPRHQYKAGM